MSTFNSEAGVNKAPIIILVPSREIDTVRPLLGISLTERAAVIVARYFGAEKAYAPHLERSYLFRGIELLAEFPRIDRPVVIVDPLLVFDGRFVRNLTVNFDAPAVACDPTTLEPIGLARLLPEHLPDDFAEAPWFHIREFLLRRQDARIAVIAARYFVVRHASDLGGAENYLLRSLVHKGDDIVERNLTRPVSRIITAWTANYRVDPRLWTLLVMFVGIAAACMLFLTGATESVTLALLLCVAAVLSSVDGETARLTFQTSRGGGVLNYYASRIVVWSYFLALTLLLRDAPPVQWCGLIFSVVYPLLVVRYDRYRHGAAARPPRSPLRRLEQALRRHFSIHAVALSALLLAALGILKYAALITLPLAAVGALVVLGEALFGRMERRK
ncbi:MAG TPA: CDP-alcohol phosphatidyltransferase family protein [bacterium]|nr:CDP-alcohol phosphatidyltransferase family protein [bacterium]